MHSVKRVFGGFGVIRPAENPGEIGPEIIVEKFTGKGAKAKAEARADFLNGGPGQHDLPAVAASGAAMQGRGRDRGGYRG